MYTRVVRSVLRFRGVRGVPETNVGIDYEELDSSAQVLCVPEVDALTLEWV